MLFMTFFYDTLVIKIAIIVRVSMAYHTYDFLRRRKNDPKWRGAYESARLQRTISFVFVLAIIAIVLFIYKYNIDVMYYVNIVVEKIENIYKSFTS